MMASLQVRGPDHSATKQRALEDAKKMQKAIIEGCKKTGKDIPQYHLSELIGKGSFGRVYKAKSLSSGKLVAIKIIDIEEGDTANPKLADTYSDLLKEIKALQLLSQSGAKNVNHVIEALPVGQAMWMVTEYCAGGSVATLMRPTAPGGLQEKWIIPILREVAEAMHWVHGEGIIHRDLKCANVLITEVGDVQLCDFGVAGVIETKFDKRTTFIGTPHWMAPELFSDDASYGIEVDIWAFGAMVYEIASGVPPNVVFGMDLSKISAHLKQHSPRLEGDQYSAGLKDLVSYCLQNDPKKRPSIEQIQKHRYLFKTEDEYPTSSLSHLVRAFKLWEAQGGDRRSLFSVGGAQGLSEVSSMAPANDDWNFSTTAAFDQQVLNNGGAQDVYDVYGSDVDFSQQSFDEATLPAKPKSRRRPPPQLPSVKAPLEKIFDPNTLSSYDDNSRLYYGKMFQPPPPPPPPAPSDLPLRNGASASDVRESLIDLDASLHGTDLAQFTDVGTIRAVDPAEYDFGDGSYQGPNSDPIDAANNRRTRDWKFPTMATLPASANPEAFRFPFTTAEASGSSPGSSGPDSARPPLLHRPTEPSLPSAGFHEMAPSESSSFDNRASMGSLIDLDMSFADSGTDLTRPSTAHSDVPSMSGSEVGGANPFELEKHASLYVPPSTMREPSLYVSDDSEFSSAVASLSDGALSPEPNRSDVPEQTFHTARPYSLSEFADTDPESMTPPQTATLAPVNFPHFPNETGSIGGPQGMFYSDAGLPHLPEAPSSYVMQGRATSDEIKQELHRMAMSLSEHLSHTNAYLSNLPVRRGSTVRVDSLDESSSNES